MSVRRTHFVFLKHPNFQVLQRVLALLVCS